MRKSKKKLPKKLSDLIEVALHDLEACEKSDEYTVDMGRWHYPSPDSPCEVCLAGSVMAQTLGTKTSRIACPGDFGGDVQQALHALDEVRHGPIGLPKALRMIDGGFVDAYDDLTKKVWLKTRYVPYGIKPARFKKYLQDVIGILRDHQL